jgi:hypothetical protein
MVRSVPLKVNLTAISGVFPTSDLREQRRLLISLLISRRTGWTTGSMALEDMPQR